MEIGEWYFSGDDTEVELGLRYLQEQTYISQSAGVQRQYSLFQRPQGRSRYNRTLAFAKPRDARHGSPLMAGQLKVQRIDGDDFTPSRYRFLFELKLNPTRALNHQPLHQDIRAGRQTSNYPARPRLFRGYPVYRAGDEIALERNDNVILDRRQQAMSTAGHWRPYRNLYLQEVDRFLGEALGRAFGRPDFTGSFFRAPRFNLKAVETYWEFRSDDPVRLIYGVAPVFRSLGTRSQFRLYEGVVSDLTTAGHVPTLNFRVVEGVTAKLYAKTTKRVRFETLHDLSVSRRVSSSHTRPDVAGIVNLIDALAAHDAQEVNMVMETLERHLSPAGEQHEPPYELMRLIMLSTTDETLQRSLLSLIINARGLRCHSGDPFRPAVDQLVRWGLLERSRPHSSSYRVAERFIRACGLLSTDQQQF